MEAELRTKDAIISDYKNITQILQVLQKLNISKLSVMRIQNLFGQGKLDTLSGKGEREEQGQGDIGPMDGAVERIRCFFLFSELDLFTFLSWTGNLSWSLLRPSWH